MRGLEPKKGGRGGYCFAQYKETYLPRNIGRTLQTVLNTKLSEMNGLLQFIII